MRPVYETSEMKQREEIVANLYARIAKLKIRRCPKFYPCDWVALDEDDRFLKSLIEIKIREVQYPDYMISLHKVTQMIHCAAVAGINPMLVVWWRDKRELGVVNLMTCERTTGYGGRSDRGDPQDMEPVVRIALAEFYRTTIDSAERPAHEA